MASPLNVALIGFGLAGHVFHAPLIEATPGLCLHTVVSSDAAKVAALHPHVRVLAAPDDAFADAEIDLVVIATPNHTHAPLASAALAQGRHVVVDKPFALDIAEAGAVIEAAERAQRVLSVFHNRRWDADFLSLRGLLANGTLGRVSEVHSHFDRFRPQVPDRWRDRPGPGAGLWYDLGPHLLDQALQLFGMPLAIQADLGMQRDDAQTVDYFHVQLRYARLRVLLHAGSLVPGHGLRFAVHGDRGSWLKHGLDPQEDALRTGAIPGGPDWGRDPRPGTLLRVHDDGSVAEQATAASPGDYRAYYAGVRDAIAQGAPVPVSAQDALLTMRLIEAGIASDARRGEIALD